MDFDTLTPEQKAAFRDSPLGRELAAQNNLYAAQDARKAAARRVTHEEQALQAKQPTVDAQLAALQRQRDDIDEQRAAIEAAAHTPLQQARAQLAEAEAVEAAAAAEASS